MKFGIVVGKDNKKAGELYSKIEEFLKGRGHESTTKDFEGADFIITLGGDGTLIHAACANLELGVPYVGINVGRLGFLTAVESGDWKEALEKLIKGDYFISERMTLDAKVVAGSELLVASKKLTRNQKPVTSYQYRAVNEVVIKGLYRVVDLEVNVNNQKFISASGDGVIVATQTGSTAYSLSAGGPIVDSDLDCLLLTPVNAHGLPVPSVVLSPDDEVEVTVKEGENVTLVIDGQEHAAVSKGQSVKVSKGKYRVKLVYFDEHQFLKSLNAKFGLAGRLSK